MEIEQTDDEAFAQLEQEQSEINQLESSENLENSMEIEQTDDEAFAQLEQESFETDESDSSEDLENSMEIEQTDDEALDQLEQESFETDQPDSYERELSFEEWCQENGYLPEKKLKFEEWRDQKSHLRDCPEAEQREAYQKYSDDTDRRNSEKHYQAEQTYKKYLEWFRANEFKQKSFPTLGL